MSAFGDKADVDRCADVDVNAMVKRLGLATLLPDIGRRSRCTACGAKGGSVQVVAVRWQAG